MEAFWNALVVDIFDLKTMIGMVAGFLTTAAFLPQMWRVWKTKQARDVSLATYAIFVTGIALWFIYGLMINSVPVTLYNALSFVFAASVVVMKLRFG